MNLLGLTVHFVLLLAAAAIVGVTATAEPNGHTYLRISNDNRRSNGALIRSKSKTIADYHTILDVMKVNGNSAANADETRAVIDPRCGTCETDCPPICYPTTPTPPCPTCPPTWPTPPPTYPTSPTWPTPPPTWPTYTPPTPTPITKPPCTNCNNTCPPVIKPSTSTYPNLPSITFSTNCDFCDHDLYTLTCIESPFDCASRCAVDVRCSHFTYIANLKGGTCILKKAFGSGGAWASSVPSPSPYVCGYIPSRALIGIFLNICVGLDITGTVRTGTA